MNNHDKDVLACLKVEMRCLLRGATVSRPITEFARYDRVIDWHGRLYRAQIKYVSCVPFNCVGAVQLNLRKESRPFYTADEIDALLVYVPTTDGVYWFGPEIFAGRSALQIRLEPPLNNQVSRCLMAENYLW